MLCECRLDQRRRRLVTHGDEFDGVVLYARWLAFLGDRGYEFALWLNSPLNWLRRSGGLGYWSLSAYLKYRVKKAVNFIGQFEKVLTEEGKGFLRSVGAALQRKAGIWKSVAIEGHTDATGTPEDNLSLSDRRAEAVGEILTSQFQIPPAWFATTSLRFSEPTSSSTVMMTKPIETS